MISAKITERPHFFVLMTAVVFFFIRKYAFFAVSDAAEPTVLFFDIARLEMGELSAAVTAAVLGTFYLFIAYKTAERVFGVREGVFAAVATGCNIGAFMLFHRLEAMSFLLVFASGFIGVLLIMSAKPRALDGRYFTFFHLFFLLSCAVGILPTVLILCGFIAAAFGCEKNKTPPIKVLLNWRTVLLMSVEVGSVVLLRYFLCADGGRDFWRQSFTFVYVNDWRQYLKTLFAFFVLFVPSIFFIAPAVPFWKAVKKNAEFRIFPAWVAVSSAIGAAFCGWFGCLLSTFPMAVMLGCVIANMALDSRRYPKSCVSAIAVPSLAIALFFMTVARSGMTEVRQTAVWYLASFAVAYIAFSGGYNMMKGRYYPAFRYFAAGYALVKIVLSLGI